MRIKDKKPIIKFDDSLACQNMKNKIQNSIQLFHLEELYNCHEDMILKCIWDSSINVDKYERNFSGILQDLGIVTNKKLSILIGDEKESLTIPLSKMISDLKKGNWK